MKKTKNKNKTKNKQQKRTLMRNKGEPARSIMSHSMIRRYHLILKNPILFILFSTWDNKMSLFLKKISFSVVFWTKVDTDTGRRPINVACFFFSQQDNRMEEKENENFFSQTSLKKSRKKKKQKKNGTLSILSQRHKANCSILVTKRERIHSLTHNTTINKSLKFKKSFHTKVWRTQNTKQKLKIEFQSIVNNFSRVNNRSFTKKSLTFSC